MTLMIPINTQALRVTPNDASLVTKKNGLFAGATTAYEGLPWREPDIDGAIIHSGAITKANVSSNIYTPLNASVMEQLNPGIHLHWALPDTIAQGVQAADSSVNYPPAPNRWLVTRLIKRKDGLQVKQWVVESDYLMTFDEYVNTYFPENRRNSISLPVGWDVPPGYDIDENGGAAYYPPSRRMGRVFELSGWQPMTDTPTPKLTEIHHLNAFTLSAANFMAPGKNLGSLSAMGNSGPSFSAYYPDCRSVFGFHDTFLDLGDDFTLSNVSFEVSYQVSGWHSKATEDPLQIPGFRQALAAAIATNSKQAPEKRETDAQVAAEMVKNYYQWSYDPEDAKPPTRCIYDSQISAIPWDTTGDNPIILHTQSGFPKCYLAPLAAKDESIRVSIGSSSSAALAALIKEQWTPEAVDDGWHNHSTDIEQNLEFMLDALQLGLLQKVGSTLTLVQLEQEIHRRGFGSFQGGRIWMIRQKQSGGTAIYATPRVTLPVDGNKLAEKLNCLNRCQQRLDALLNVIVTCRQQIFMDWYKYITGLYDETGSVPFQEPDMNRYLSEQILDLWAKFEAAFGKQSEAGPATNNIPVFYSSPGDYIVLEADGTYSTKSPEITLVGQIVKQANALITLLANDYKQFELTTTTAARYWQANEPILVATGDSLQPARRNGNIQYLPCRLSAQLISRTNAAISGSSASEVTAATIRQTLSLSVPEVDPKSSLEATDLQAILDDLANLLGEKCLLDSLLTPALVSCLSGVQSADFLVASQALTATIQKNWAAGVLDKSQPSMVLVNPSENVGNLTVTWKGQAPQGLALNASADWQDPFLPLFLLWEAEFTPFEKGETGAAYYNADYLIRQFQLDQRGIELVVGQTPPQPTGGSVTIGGSIILSSKVAEPLLEQLRQYLKQTEDPRLQEIATYLAGKPLLAQGLSGVNASFLTRATGLQMQPFNPFYEDESTPTKLVNSYDNMLYRNSLTNFAAWAAGTETGQVPISESSLYNILRSGFFKISKLDVVDVFGRKRPLLDTQQAADREKVIVSWQMQSPVTPTRNEAYLAPRIAQASRLLFRWISAGNDEIEMSSAVAVTSPVCGWIVPNYLENALMFFTGEGKALGELGVFGAQKAVTWHSAAGNPAQSMNDDLAGANRYIKKLAEFIFAKPREFFRELLTTIRNAHTYILPNDQEAASSLAVLTGQPLALVRAGLRLESDGVPAFDTSSQELARLLPGQNDKSYDWTLRNCAKIREVKFPVRLGDRDHLEDGLVAYFLDSDEPYTTMYAPAATETDTVEITRPADDTITLNLHANIDPPAQPYNDVQAQITDLRDCSIIPVQTTLSLLIDPRAQVHATTGFLPVKAINIPPDITAAALRNIEVTFFTHPILRSRQGLSLPISLENGYVWNWTTSMIKDGKEMPQDEPLPAMQAGGRAAFSYTPQTAEDGWLTLTPVPATEQKDDQEGL
jgi:hypothetical protein